MFTFPTYAITLYWSLGTTFTNLSPDKKNNLTYFFLCSLQMCNIWSFCAAFCAKCEPLVMAQAKNAKMSLGQSEIRGHLRVETGG